MIFSGGRADGGGRVSVEMQPLSTGHRRGCHHHLTLNLLGQFNFLQVDTGIGFLILSSAKSLAF